MTKPLVIILMGSKGDLDHCQIIAEACRTYKLEPVLHVASAHKTPEHLMKLLKDFEADPRPKVYITVAGRSNALSGFTDGAVSAPVIACPPTSDAFGGADLYSSLRMPSGIAPAVVLEPANAALFAAKIFGLSDPEVRLAVTGSQKRAAEKILQDDKAIE
jgi:5-(carboxyamino)imidazole ribonucleotide mutase